MANVTTVPEVLTRARDLVVPAMRRSIDMLNPQLRSIAAYHLGWEDAKGESTGSDGGKGVRPALALLSAEAMGARGEYGLPGAVAIELVHNYSLIHDDVMDVDRERRHRPTVWAVFGIAQAIIVGDALAALAQQIVLDPRLLVADGQVLEGHQAALLLADATAKMIAGQSQDMEFEGRGHVSFDECLAMEAGKTGALLGCAAAIGAVLVNAPMTTVGALDRFGVELGLAFQAVDDLLGIWGDPKTTGKPSWSDLRQHKKSLPVTAALSSGESGVEELLELLAIEQLSERQIERCAELVERLGGRDATNELADTRLLLALDALDEAEILDDARRQFIEIAHFVVERQF
ncbi:MAG TPA: polyprenyl synthetase family protein [Acidimicrobiales bacterium]|nr:polyprenyl synthetase family protein [Acidimicrobiales bacterium]